MNSGHILHACAHHLNWRQGVLVPEAVVEHVNIAGPRPYSGSYLADLMWVTRDRYATEIEIKVSRADWRADLVKAKWGHLPPWIARFVYAVPEELGIPDFVPLTAGIWHIRADGKYCRVVRAPRRIGKERVPDKVLEWWKGHLYYRYWYNLLHGPRLPMPELADAAD